MCRGECECGPLETSKLEISSKLRVSVGLTRRIEFVVNRNETKVYVLGFYVGSVAARSF